MTNRAQRRAQRSRYGGVCVTYPYIEDPSGFFTESLANMLVYDANHGGEIVHHGGHLPARNASLLMDARNQTVRRFLSDPHAGEWLLCVDSDMMWRPDALHRLLAFADPKDRPVVGGLCFAGQWGVPIRPTLYMFDRELPLDDWPDGQPIQVDGTGLAFLLIHRQVLEEMGAKNEGHTLYPWFETGAFQGRNVGEDIVFCLRLKGMGVPVWVHTGVEIGHVKPWPITKELYLAMRAGEAVAGGG